MRSFKSRSVLIAALLAVTVSGVVAAGVSGQRRAPQPESATAVLRSPRGAMVGTVELTQRARGQVEFRVAANRLSPGFHGFHVHEKGICAPRSQDAQGRTGAFLSAGGHFKFGAQEHGQHAGDLPPLFVNRDGTARATFTADSFLVRSALDRDGSALMVHATRDNQGNIPGRYSTSAGSGPDADTRASGDTGARLACGVLARVRR